MNDLPDRVNQEFDKSTEELAAKIAELSKLYDLYKITEESENKND